MKSREASSGEGRHLCGIPTALTEEIFEVRLALISTDIIQHLLFQIALKHIHFESLRSFSNSSLNACYHALRQKIKFCLPFSRAKFQYVKAGGNAACGKMVLREPPGNSTTTGVPKAEVRKCLGKSHFRCKEKKEKKRKDLDEELILGNMPLVFFVF